MVKMHCLLFAIVVIGISEKCESIGINPLEHVQNKLTDLFSFQATGKIS